MENLVLLTSLGGDDNYTLVFDSDGYQIKPKALPEMPQKKDYDYYVLELLPQFKEFPLSKIHREYQIVPRSATLKIDMKNGNTRSCFPSKIEEDPVKAECEQQIEFKADGSIELKPWKAGAETKKTVKLKFEKNIENRNVTCYATRSPKTARWVFTTRRDEQFLLAGKPVWLVIESPKRSPPSGMVSFEPEKLGITKERRLVEGFIDEIILSLRGLKPQPKHYAPINIDFTFPRLTPFRIAGRIQRTAFSPAEPEFDPDIQSVIDDLIEAREKA